MAKTRKTQPPPSEMPDASIPDAAAIAQHFMTAWQEQWQNQWQNWVRNVPPEFNPVGFGMTPAFGQTASHGPSPVPDATALELATAALAAAEQCLELLKQCAGRLDALERRVGDAPPKPGGKSPPRR